MSERYTDGRNEAPDSTPGSERESRRSAGFSEAVDRLERAVSALEGSTRERLSERATRVLDEAADRLEREANRRGRHGHRRRRRRHAYGGCSGTWWRARSSRAGASETEEHVDGKRRLQLDPERARLCGVCAGVARYHGMEPWVARCIAVTGALFFPSIVIPAYFIAWFVMDKPGRARRREWGRERPDEDRTAGAAPASASRVPEPDVRPSPRRRLDELKERLSGVEMRLRRMETHVTSGGYELQRELNRIAKSV